MSARPAVDPGNPIDGARPRLDPSVRMLGLVSLLNDFSSEVTIRALPLFLSNVLGVATTTIGVIEGLGESASTLLRIVSGGLADRLGRRKPLTLAGYALSGFSKPLLYFASSWTWVLGVRLLDRIGKGVRTPPRDAMIADLTDAGDRGRAFGYNKAMDKVGAVAGLLAAAAVVQCSQHSHAGLTRGGYQALVLLAIPPGIASVLVLARGVREKPAPARASPAASQATEPVGRPFLGYLAILGCFSLGNSSDAFLMLRAQSLGIPTVTIFLMVAAFSLAISLSSTPGGALSDRLGRKRLMALGWLIYAAIYLGFARATSPWHVAALYVGYGLYYGAFQGAATALVADLVPASRRGWAYGLFNAVVGVAALPASVVAGWLWQVAGPPAPFVLGAALALVAALMLMALPAPRRTQSQG